MLWNHRAPSVQERLRAEHNPAPQPRYYEYPTEGCVMSEMDRREDVVLYHIADFSEKVRKYSVIDCIDGTVYVYTTDRAEAYKVFEEAADNRRQKDDN